MEQGEIKPSLEPSKGAPARDNSRKPLRLFARYSLHLALFAALFGITAWACAALYFDFPIPLLRGPVAGLYGLGVLLSWFLVRRRAVSVALTIFGFGLILGAWLMLQPSNGRDWQPDVAILPYATISGDEVTIRNIRDCTYRSPSDFDVNHYDRTLDLNSLSGIYIYLVYWGSPHIAHTMLSFEFADTNYVCVSIETRKERGEGYSAFRGFFRQYELTYVIADERDVVRLRTNFRGEEVYLYRINATKEQARILFLTYLAHANKLKDRPAWYNALTSNCTTNIRLNSNQSGGFNSAFDWRIVLNGHGDQMLYERGRIFNGLPFSELRQQSHINAQAQAADPLTFSGAIRVDLPKAKL